jgi:hypothetical protein
MNTMNKQKTILNIDSKYRDPRFRNPADFEYTLHETIKNVTSVRLSSIEYPNLHYTITSAKKNNYFVITVKSTGTNYTVTLDEGVYSPESIIQELQAKLDAVSLASGVSFNVNLSTIDFKTTIDGSSDFSINFDNSPSINVPLGYYLGYRSTTYTTPTTSGLLFLYKSESIMDTVGENYIFLKINDYGHVIQDYGKLELRNGNYVRSENKEIYFAKIILNGPKMALIVDTGANFVTKEYILPNPDNIRKLKFQLIDSNGEIIDLINFNFSMTLEIEHFNKL